MKKILYLSTCDTCKRIMNETGTDGFELQDIKSKHIDPDTLQELRKQVNSYEDLFNKRARKFRAEGLNKQSLSEEYWMELILDEYTYLKRPIYMIDGQAYIGNSKKTVEAIKSKLGE